MTLSHLKLPALIGTFAALTACSTSGTVPLDEALGSAFLPVPSGPNGSVIADPANERNGRLYDATIGGAAYVTGTTDSGAQAASGIMDNPTVGATGSGANVRYDTRYQVIEIENVSVTGNLLRGNQNDFSGGTTLTANFDAGTVTGGNNDFAVDGVIQDQAVSGTVTSRGRTGEMAAVIGQDAVVGAFHGTGTDSVFAGGFLGNSITPN